MERPDMGYRRTVRTHEGLEEGVDCENDLAHRVTHLLHIPYFVSFDAHATL